MEMIIVCDEFWIRKLNTRDPDSASPFYMQRERRNGKPRSRATRCRPAFASIYETSNDNKVKR